MDSVIFYTKDRCSLCDEAEALLSLFNSQYSFTVMKRDIYSNDKWLEAYQLEIPVIELKGRQLNCNEINYDSIERLFKQS
ncbi:glutaredoxin family protein [Oceanobacillus massiliensis]|uniref:glutaredoxin family protein n=1 Tax=Oceanobacillus massiliensis TaxID=1465765 RepID=UPI0002893B42|nr:glutaredoxin family protein [Oceanobacillus massiliensis]